MDNKDIVIKLMWCELQELKSALEKYDTDALELILDKYEKPISRN